jgi:hypothetical protein
VELTAALISAFIVSVALLLAIQAYYHGGVALERTTNRARAMMVLESQAEIMRAAGIGALPQPGTHILPGEALRGLPGATGSLTVAEGPRGGMRTVRLDIEWPEENGPRGKASLLFAMSQDGLSS